MRRLAITGFVALILSGCAEPSRLCPAGSQPMRMAELFFGRGLPGGGTVADADWSRFVDEEITPRFPAGLTVEDAAGQWRGTSGLVGERSKHLMILLPGTAGDAAKLAAIREAYRRRFAQDSVLLVQTPVCGSF